MMNPYIKGSLYTILLIATTEVLYRLFAKSRKKNKFNKHSQHAENESKSRLSSTSIKVLIFPDDKIACREHFISSSGCLKQDCRFSHADTSLSELYRLLISCRQTLDVCVYVFTCRDLADILLILHKRGLKIRIITDGDQLQSSSSQIWALRKAGIPVRTNSSSYFMHHKFTIIDSKILINGSFNWTHQAVTGNNENVIVTDDDAVTPLFVSEFQKLWESFGTNAL